MEYAIFQSLGFVVGFIIAASSFRELLFVGEDKIVAWLCCIASGIFIALFELVVMVATS